MGRGGDVVRRDSDYGMISHLLLLERANQWAQDEARVGWSTVPCSLSGSLNSLGRSTASADLPGVTPARRSWGALGNQPRLNRHDLRQGSPVGSHPAGTWGPASSQGYYPCGPGLPTSAMS